MPERPPEPPGGGERIRWRRRDAGAGSPSGGINAPAARPGRRSAAATRAGRPRRAERRTCLRGGDAGGRVEATGERLERGRRRLAALEVLAAPRAQRPVETDEAAAVRADAVQPGPAGRADDPFLVDAPIAGRAVVDRFDLRKEGLLGQVALPHLADLLVRPDDLVDPHGEEEEERGEEDDPRRREVGRNRVGGALLHVAECPVGRCQPYDDEIGEQQLDPELDDRVREEIADRVADRSENLIHESWVGASGSWGPSRRSPPSSTSEAV